jgi:hypothetical protein
MQNRGMPGKAPSVTQIQPLSKPPLSQTQPLPQQNSNSNERAVREMLITLIRAKTYKKLDEIQRHMANEGLQTSIQTLKRIIDEIKAKNAQRKAQS